MYRLFILALTLCFLPLSGLAEDALICSGELTGTYIWPEDADETEANYIYRYAYPVFEADTTLDETVNEVFQSEVSWAMDFECPMYITEPNAANMHTRVNVSSEITCLNTEMLSIRVDRVFTTGSSSSNKIKSFTFMLNGTNAGTITSLPYLLGILKTGESDEWYIQRQIDKADKCVREMVWAEIEKDRKLDDSAIYDFITLEDLDYCFYPEEDFYLDEAGGFVFYIQAGEIAPPEAGHFTYTFTLDELLDEI